MKNSFKITKIKLNELNLVIQNKNRKKPLLLNKY